MDDIPAIITACATAITALGGLVLAIKVLIPTLRATREVHIAVNSERTAAQAYRAKLVEALHAAGIAVPIDLALEPTPEEE